MPYVTPDNLHALAIRGKRMTEEREVDRRSATEVNEELLRQQIEKAAKEIKEREEKNFRDGCALYALQGLVQGYAWYFRKTAAGAEAGCDQEVALPVIAKLVFDMADAMLEERRARDFQAFKIRQSEKNAVKIIEAAQAEGIEVLDYVSNEDILNLSQSAEEFLRSFRHAHKKAAAENQGTKWGARWHKHFQKMEAMDERTGSDGKAQEAEETEGTQSAASQHQS